jgi:hypothetical protein
MTDPTSFTTTITARIPFALPRVALRSSWLAPFAWDSIDTSYQNATAPLSGMAVLAYPSTTNKGASSMPKARLFAETGKNPEAVSVPVTITNTSAQGAETILMEPSSALSLRKLRAHSPLIPEAWDLLL